MLLHQMKRFHRYGGGTSRLTRGEAAGQLLTEMILELGF
jgi:hypothetical protein